MIFENKIYGIEEIKRISLEKEENCRFKIGTLNNETIFAESYVDTFYNEEKGVLTYFIDFIEVDSMSPSPILAYTDEATQEFQTNDGDLDSLLEDVRFLLDVEISALLEDSMILDSLDTLQFNGDKYYHFDNEEVKKEAIRIFEEKAIKNISTSHLDAILSDSIQDLEYHLYELEEVPENYVNSVCDKSFDEMNQYERKASIATIKEYLKNNS